MTRDDVQTAVRKGLAVFIKNTGVHMSTGDALTDIMFEVDLVLAPPARAPSLPMESDIWYDGQTKTAYVYQSGSWRPVPEWRFTR